MAMAGQVNASSGNCSMADIKTVSVVGLGYVGLPTCAILASRGLQVTGVDVNEAVVEKVNLGQIHIVEPDLDGLIQKVVAIGKLRACNKPQVADAHIIAVPTPMTHDYKPDISHVLAAARSIAPVLKRGDLVMLESTSPVGTTRSMTELLSKLRPDLKFPLMHGEKADILVAYSPERVLPGKILTELATMIAPSAVYRAGRRHVLPRFTRPLLLAISSKRVRKPQNS
jgi:UDP-N-acetyl-D-mannosaminuronic acid dehydrogenase